MSAFTHINELSLVQQISPTLLRANLIAADARKPASEYPTCL